MKIENKIKQRLGQLIAEGEGFIRHQDEFHRPSDYHVYDYHGWRGAVTNIVNLITQGSSAYQCGIDNFTDVTIYSHPEITSILKNFSSDIEAGLITSIEDQTKAFVFDELIDHAKDLLARKQKDPAGIIAGVAFEDTFRNICRKNNVCEKGVNLDNLISEIQKNRFIQPSKGKASKGCGGC